ncbi:hypothetical protein HanPI659440_Chr04g0152851 [Helianthus annuus]|nr:hypothetical protein HanPI659440_Chr04g0152851 [Helianthus annuus]
MMMMIDCGCRRRSSDLCVSGFLCKLWWVPPLFADDHPCCRRPPLLSANPPFNQWKMMMIDGGCHPCFSGDHPCCRLPPNTTPFWVA